MTKLMTKIVVVEDDPFLLKVYQSKLIDPAYQVSFANDGQAGWDLIQQIKPNLILLDLIMPKMDGFQILEQLKESGLIKNSKVIVLTNLGQEEDRKRCLELGAVDFVVKSDTPINEILSKIKKYVQ